MPVAQLVGCMYYHFFLTSRCIQIQALMCLAEFERFAIPNMFLEGTIRKSRRGDNNLPRDTYHVLTICIAVVSTNKQNSLLSLCLAVIRMTRTNQDRTQALGLRVKRIR